ncbi:hypothetical protein M9H77_32214 [Catharanthus roseus]|uniref:Uncharacterized protein n=2 Tax=Catharanthus roseus TaxID=4058 RepID=A0ACC0A3I8_CATRO|nr:hypothetical protein M9H77_32213 [Catharanthus roseus]KAI5655027.1 hypothetical protein M9H77_32214 [Catharanthus roseus]
MTGGRPAFLDISGVTCCISGHWSLVCPGVKVGRPSFPVLCSPRDLLKSLGFHGPCPGLISVRVAASTAAANPIGGKGANARCNSTLNPFTNCRVLFSSVSINLKQYLANLLNFAVYWATVRLPCLNC